MLSLMVSLVLVTFHIKLCCVDPNSFLIMLAICGIIHLMNHFLYISVFLFIVAHCLPFISLLKVVLFIVNCFICLIRQLHWQHPTGLPFSYVGLVTSVQLAVLASTKLHL